MSYDDVSRSDGADDDFDRALSLIAALEGAVHLDGQNALLPYLGMARAELCDFSQRPVNTYVAVDVFDVRAAMSELAQRLTELLAMTDVEQYRLRIAAAMRHLRHGIATLPAG